METTIVISSAGGNMEHRIIKSPASPVKASFWVMERREADEQGHLPDEWTYIKAFPSPMFALTFLSQRFGWLNS